MSTTPSPPTPDAETAKATHAKRKTFWQRVFSAPLPRSEMTPAQRFYDSWSSVPMFVVAMLWLASTFFSWSPALAPTYRKEGFTLSLMTWVIFAIDMMIRFILDPDKKDFVKRNWPLLIALAFPPLRIILVVAAVMRIARDRNTLAKVVGLYALYAVLFVVIFGALFTLIFEINAPGANITSFGDAVWWGFVTVTTVGYGDFTPVTIGGRFVAVLIMFTGAAAVGAVTAAVASRFINSGSRSGNGSGTSGDDATSSSSQKSQMPLDPHPSPAIGPILEREEDSLTTLLAQIQQLQSQVSDIADRLGATRGNRGE